MISNTYQEVANPENRQNTNLQHNILLDFFPSRESLPTNLVSIKQALLGSNLHKFNSIKLSTNSSFVLLLIPLIVPIKDRLKVEFSFETNSRENLYDSNYEGCKNFKDILEASLVLSKIGVEVSFNKTLKQ